jgi:hypothetical protein
LLFAGILPAGDIYSNGALWLLASRAVRLRREAALSFYQRYN